MNKLFFLSSRWILESGEGLDVIIWSYVSWGDQLEICAGGYLTKSSANPGAGDLLMGFLGSVILSFAFSLFRQRKVSM